MIRAERDLRAYVEHHDFAGSDPYDVLRSPLPFHWLGHWGPVLAVQVHKRNPLDLRRLLRIAPGRNAKGIGLLLQAYCHLHRTDGDDASRETADALFAWLRDHTSPGYSGACWGYNFDWASPGKYLPAETPSVVVTGFIAQGLGAYHALTGSDEAAALLRSACDFVLRDLPRTETADGVCLSYTPVQRDVCYNASLLGAETLARAYAVTGEAELRDLAGEAVRFVLARQHADGHWGYSLADDGRERAQIDFHQGFVLDSLRACQLHAGVGGDGLDAALRAGLRFYRERQFEPSGRSLWRLPRRWPVDIHHQAQGVLTFTRLAHLDAGALAFADAVARWTVEHMQRPDGAFHYRHGRWLRDRTPHMRWGLAWMLLALSELRAARSDAPRAARRARGAEPVALP